MATPSSTGANTAVSVGTSAVQLVDGTTGRRGVLVKNNHATQILYVGNDANVTTSNGFPIAAGGSQQFDNYTGTLYGIGSGAATDARIFETG
jgi:hypothetical protein